MCRCTAGVPPARTYFSGEDIITAGNIYIGTGILPAHDKWLFFFMERDTTPRSIEKGRLSAVDSSQSIAAKNIDKKLSMFEL